jgi:MFS family permease
VSATEISAQPSSRSLHALDWFNFFLADVQTGFGAFLAAYLASRGWSQGSVGTILAAGTLTAVISQMPGGALVDAVAAKRLAVAIGLGLIGAGALVVAFWPTYLPVLATEILHGSTGGVVSLSITAIGLGLVGHRGFSERLGRNRRFGSIGNAATGAMMGLIGHFISKQAAFIAVAALCLPALAVVDAIKGEEIDYARSRSAAGKGQPRQLARYRDIARNRPLAIFTAALVLFQFSNASLLPLVSERLVQQHHETSQLFTAALVATPQVITAVIAAWIAHVAERWGRKPLLIGGFATLPIRALFFVLAPAPWFLIPIQALDGMTAAVIGILTPLVIQDLTHGSGRYNLAQGALGTMTGVGASVSTVASGYVVQTLGYASGFVALAVVGLAGVGVVWRWLPETADRARSAT